jgi:two-component system nitrogen regulation sensor histidine kinase NtrY
MVLKSFFLNILIRIILITLTCFALVKVMDRLDREYLFSFAGIAALLLLQVILLARYVNRTNRDLARFFSAVKNEGSTLVFNEIRDSAGYRSLYRSLNEVSDLIDKTRTDTARNSLFLANLVNHVGVGLVGFDPEGRVELINQAACGFLGVHVLDNLHKLPKRKGCDLGGKMLELKPGKPELVRVVCEPEKEVRFGTIQKLLLKKETIKSDKRVVNLVSIQNIITELDRNELDSWQKLIRVLTHEIMNSLSPVISLTRTITKYFTGEDDHTPLLSGEITDRIIEKTLSGMDTIRDTGEGLINFVSKYRKLTRLPQPVFTRFTIASLFERVKELMEEWGAGGTTRIEHEVDPPGLELSADASLLEQVLINLVSNSVEAINKAEKGRITLRAFEGEEAIFLQVEDNGPGIPGDIIENIFVPFFTTKETGSGIGLSLARQIMLLHEGSITAHSVPGEKTVFTLMF